MMNNETGYVSYAIVILIFLFSIISVGNASSDDFCFGTGCHSEQGSFINSSLFDNSSHRYLQCIDCHVNITEYPDPAHGNFTKTLTLPLPSSSYNSNDFLLCYSCHKESGIIGLESSYSDSLWTHTLMSGYPLYIPNISSNFINEIFSGYNFENYPANIHWDHLDMHKIDAGAGPDLIWDSDRDSVLDSMISCPACHDPHGNLIGPNLTRGDLGIRYGSDTDGEYGEITSIEYQLAGGDLYCVGCHGVGVKYYRPLREVLNFSDLHISPDDITGCIQPGCHFSNELTTEHIEKRNLSCATCHQSSEQRVITAIDQGNKSCFSCHTPHSGGAHATHMDAAKGPSISCLDCHGSESPPLFADGQDLENTGVCDICHSPGGIYDGMNDLDIGARYNWAGVYNNSTDTLKSGKEKWCAGCHDNVPSLIQGIEAPDIAGDGNTYGYYITGHGANDIIHCSSCHNLSSHHIDGIARTYSPDSDYMTYDPPSDFYQSGYRLRDVSSGYNGKYPLHIPRTGHVYPPGFREDREFALCFECHNKTQLFNPGDPVSSSGAGTNFREEYSGSWVSLHDLHTDGRNGPNGPENPQYDSNFDGTADSRMSCPACHNVHGSRSPAMVRTGELIDNVPALNLKYVDNPPGQTLNFISLDLLNISTGAGMDITSGQGQVGANGVCNMCHAQQAGGPSPNVAYYRNPIVTVPDFSDFHTTPVDMTGCIQSGCHLSTIITTEHIERGLDCATCHQSSIERVTTAIDQGNKSCFACHDPHTGGSHLTHIEAAKGPQISCPDCHSSTSLPLFADEQNLDDTTVCNTCHSPGGTYDGMNDYDIGARFNWAGVYNNSYDTLEADKEKWCAGCHDESPSIIQGVSAPNIVGGESESYTYGTGWGYYKTGHGLQSGTTFAYSGGLISGPELNCDSCHNYSINHIDGDSRTYNSSNDNYQQGYRLKSIDSNAPLNIPLEVGDWTKYTIIDNVRYSDETWLAESFRLCFKCHDSSKFINATLTSKTMFSNGSINAHRGHIGGDHLHGLDGLFWTNYWDSDWNGGDDSRVSCSTCHNVHGSTQLSMVRDGKLIDKEPGIPIRYYNNDVVFGAYGSTPIPDDITLNNSTGSMWVATDLTRICTNCHGGDWTRPSNRNSPYFRTQ